MLHGGVCHRTSTPHKSGNKMKEKKKICLCCKFGTEIRSRSPVSRYSDSAIQFPLVKATRWKQAMHHT